MPLVCSSRSALWRTLLLMALLPATLLRAAAVAVPAPIPLWPQGAPNVAEISAEAQPAIFPFLPSSATNTGTGVLLVSAKSFLGGNLENESIAVAQWLNAHGLAAFVLRYRDGQDSSTVKGDVTRAVQYLRAHAADYHLSATRIGVLGFASGAQLAAEAAFADHAADKAEASDAVSQASPYPSFLALIYGASMPKAGDLLPPPTFLVGSTNAADNGSSAIDLWNYLRSPRVKVPVEAHFFPKVDTSLDAWSDLFYNWARAYGFLTDQPRVAMHGSVLLDGKPLPHGYVIFTPLEAVGAGPIVARVFNATQGVAIGAFSVPANQGPVPGRYRVDVRQNANRWLSNTFSADLIRDPAFGHARILSPSIDDQHSFTKTHPGDKDDMVVEIKPEGAADLKIEVFSK